MEVNPSLKHNLAMLGGISYPSGFVCHNAATGGKHTEPDCSYTTIRVPNQPGMNYSERKPRACFNFHLSDSEVVQVPLCVGMSVYYSGFLVLHRQEQLDDREFYNLSAYGNRDFFCYARRTISRNVEHMLQLVQEE